VKQVYNISVSFLKSIPNKTVSVLSSLSPIYSSCDRCGKGLNESETKFCDGCNEHRRRIKENPLSFLSEVHI
jgi:hypothetical protein